MVNSFELPNSLHPSTTAATEGHRGSSLEGRRTPRLHGPSAEWTRKIDGKTVTRRLTPAELAGYQPLFDNARKLRALLAELQDLTLQMIDEDGAAEP